MPEQLQLIPKPPRLTSRQQRALDLIATEGPIMSADLGAHFHRHGPDGRCQWCGTTGAELGQALRRKGLVKQRRGHGWVLLAAADPTPEPGQPFQWPDGF